MAKQIIIKGTPVVGANEILVADSNSKIPAVDGSAITTMAGGNITGTIPTARLDTGTTANKVVVLGATGLPAVDGSLLTGIVSHTTSASDPALDTNPSGGVGTEWINSTSGKQFICTDATTGENVWTCSGGGSGDIAPISHAQGTNYGYMTGGAPGSNIIDKYSFTSDGDSVDVADLSVPRFSHPAGASSATYGYCACGGTVPGNGADVIDRFHFANGTDATDVGDTYAGRYSCGGTFSETYAYIHGGYPGPNNTIQKYQMVASTTGTDVGNLTNSESTSQGSQSATHGYVHGGQALDTIQKYQMVASANGTDVGNLTVAQQVSNGASSATHGYTTGTSANQNLEKYSFTSDGDATDVGNITPASGVQPEGCNSITHGYSVGGASSNIIEKFLFTNEGTMTDVGDLTEVKTIHTCTSSSTHGYSAGGHTGSAYTSVIHKFSFSADGNATDIGDLGSHRSGQGVAEGAPAQY